MILPRHLEAEPVIFMRLSNGGHRQVSRNEEYGVTVENFKESRDHPWKMTFTADKLPGRVFDSGKKLSEAYNEGETG